MPVPAVSPENWKRTTIITHFVMTTPISVVRDFSFEDRVMAIVEHSEGEYNNTARENESDDSEYCHADFDAPYEKKLRLGDRDSDHRPRVSEHTVKMLEQTVRQENENIPVVKMDFDNKLGVLLDAAERYFSTLQCEAIVTSAATVDEPSTFDNGSH